jgi:cytochrome oxidase Cu insertion factor (SCO1/SenC/PrrC family)
MNNSALPYWLTFAVLLAGMYGGFKWYQTEHAPRAVRVETNEINLPPLKEFELTASDGKPFRSQDMKGKVWVVSFFFSSCPGTCAKHNANIKYMTGLDEIAEVDWVSVTVDPVTDTLPVLAEYANRMNADPQQWIFCRGELDYVQRVADDILKLGGVTYKSHNDYAVIIDKQGEIANMFDSLSTQACDRAVETLKKCLAEEYAPENGEPPSEGGEATETKSAAEAA